MDTTEPVEPAAEPKPRCQNCGKKMTRKGGFCPNCGQKNFDGRVRMRDLLSRFIFGLTHLDNKFVRMSWRLLLPGSVTIDYFQGKIKRYPHPFQFFFVVMFFFLLLFSKLFEGQNFRTTNRQGEGLNFGTTRQEQGKGKVHVNNDNFYLALQRYVLGQEIRAAYDSIPARLRTRETREAMDTMIRYANGEWETAVERIQGDMDSTAKNDLKRLDSISLNFITSQVKIATTDAIRLEPEEIVVKYGITDWRERIFLRQGLKSVKDPKGLMHAYVGSMTWTILALVSLMAMVLGLLYWRQRRYYVEHFIFLLHQHSGAFLLLTLSLLVQQFYDLGGLWVLIFGWIGISLLIAMKRYYRQGYFKTTLKWLLYCFLYIIGFIFLFIVGLILVFVLF